MYKALDCVESMIYFLIPRQNLEIGEQKKENIGLKLYNSKRLMLFQKVDKEKYCTQELNEVLA